MGKQVTVVSALHTYRAADGENREALRGSVIELDSDELERALRLGAVTDKPAEPLLGPVVEPTPPVLPEDAGKLVDDEPPAKRGTSPARSRPQAGGSES